VAESFQYFVNEALVFMKGIDPQRDAPDPQLALDVLGGNTDAYFELVRRYQHRLRCVLSFHCASADEVEEHVQEAFVNAYAHLDSYDGRSPFFPWLKAIALNALRMELRRRTADQSARDYLRGVQMAAAESGPDADARLAALEACLRKLDKPQAELVASKYRAGRPLAALARLAGITETAMKVRLFRIREALRECVERSLAAGGAGA
jgi:RNA polymerase sigma-70 factor (ECF subfamily)